MGYDIAFFTEAGFSIGMGYLVRSYAIYQDFSQNNKYDFYLDSDANYDYKYDNIIYFKAPANAVIELERQMRYNEDLLRFMTVKYETKKDIKRWEEMVKNV